MVPAGNNFRRGMKIVAALAGVLLLSQGCATNPDGTTEYKRTAIGALGGAAVGAGTGAAIAGRGHRGKGALIGGLVGAAGGGAIGNYMDRQAAEMKRRLPEAAVAREGDQLYVALPSGILFDVDKAEIRPSARDAIARAAEVLVKYPGHLHHGGGAHRLHRERRTTTSGSASGGPTRSWSGS